MKQRNVLARVVPNTQRRGVAKNGRDGPVSSEEFERAHLGVAPKE